MLTHFVAKNEIIENFKQQRILMKTYEKVIDENQRK